MDSIKSFKGYGKVDEIEHQAFQRKSCRRFIIIGVSAAILLAVIIGAVVGIVIHNRDASSSPVNEITPAARLTALCSLTQYPKSCYDSLRSFNSTDPKILFSSLLRIAMAELAKLSEVPGDLAAKTIDAAEKRALEVCAEVFDDCTERLNDTVSAMDSQSQGKSVSSSSSSETIRDLETWLSAAITDLETCFDALADLKNSTLLSEVKSRAQNSTEIASNGLAFATKILKVIANVNIPNRRRLLESSGGGFPEWLGDGDRRLLSGDSDRSSAPSPVSEENLIVVAKDGTGNFNSVQEAVDAVPKKSKVRFVIRIKQGVYAENVVIGKSIWNVMMVGDGKTKTVISGSKNFIDGTPTFHTATFAVTGKGFIAKGIQFINTAGPEKHQAVAMRSGSDMSVFYQCSFDAFQDTLYAHSNRQFYRECDITGTIDFIFGTSAVVFQNCLILPRQPLPNQFNTITAQGKKDPNQNTGISIQKCKFSPKDTTLTAPTYLGRPWKEFSTTVIMQSEIGGFLNKLGWKEWVSGTDPPATIFYGEYRNSGPGSTVENRVKWAGYKPALSDAEARKFSVLSFIDGADWLNLAGVEFQSTL